MTAVEPWKLHRWREAFAAITVGATTGLAWGRLIGCPLPWTALPWLILVVAVADFARRFR